MTSRQATRGEFTGRHMWLIVVAFFGTIIAVNATMAVVASTSWTGLVVKNSYVASQEFEARRLAHLAQVGAGWTASLSYADGMAVLLVTGAGGAIDLGEPVLQINRPVGGHDDQHVVLTPQADGSYSGPVRLDTGVWEARVEVPETVLGPFELHERFRIGGATP
jgi:nitrogen fixation protein FixH